MNLTDIIDALQRIAPLEWAEEWDNVGLLIEPSEGRAVERILLAIDLTEPVLEEALGAGAEMIVAYHPPIFVPLKRLTLAEVKQRIVLRALAGNVAVYSPHTALDAAPGGVNDFLAAALGPGEAAPIQPVPPDPATGRPNPRAGQGRRVVLERSASLDGLIGRLKEALGLPHLRVACAARHGEASNIGTVALCAGAGGSVLQDQPVDLFLTGEMRHHDILAAVGRGTSVVLTEHTNSERPYLEVLRDRLTEALGPDIAIDISQRDADPLRVV